MQEVLDEDAYGNKLLTFSGGAEDLRDLRPGIPVTAALVVVHNQVRHLLMVFDRWRQQWELPGGQIERGETPRQAAVREFVEGSGKAVPELTDTGTATFELVPDSRLEHIPIFRGFLSDFAGFAPNDEIAAISWWDRSPMPHLAHLDSVLWALAFDPT